MNNTDSIQSFFLSAREKGVAGNKQQATGRQTKKSERAKGRWQQATGNRQANQEERQEERVQGTWNKVQAGKLRRKMAKGKKQQAFPCTLFTRSLVPK
ncbi:MAG: hypothetical protein LBL13_14225 [Bacteroidales bacterium]|nr:hypothetical protein [Bacteroidales bacterium]